MLHRERLKGKFKEKHKDFMFFFEAQKRYLVKYLGTLEKISRLKSEEIKQKTSENENIGAVPSEEIDDLDVFSIEFGKSWNNHEEAREWAQEILENRVTFAADGSHYYSEKDASLPIGAVQIGWFENPHNGDERYEKNTDLVIFSPRELLENQEEPLKPESRINEEMFFGEIKKTDEFLSKAEGWRDRNERMPLAFLDRPMLLPFAALQSKLQKRFIDVLVNLIKHSRKVKVPVVGYVDRGFSHDIINLISAFCGETLPDWTLYDATILGSKISKNHKILRSWGDRTPFCYSRRKGLEAFIDNKTDESIVGFSYLQTTSDSPPARLDMPIWVYKDGLLEEVLDVVRAECVIGLGYPYSIEAADAAAFISFRDRQTFLRTLQEFAKDNNLGFSFSKKDVSKKRKRQMR